MTIFMAFFLILLSTTIFFLYKNTYTCISYISLAWVAEDPDDPKSAICQICNTSMKALKGILESHQRSKKHMKNVAGPGNFTFY